MLGESTSAKTAPVVATHVNCMQGHESSTNPDFDAPQTFANNNHDLDDAEASATTNADLNDSQTSINTDSTCSTSFSQPSPPCLCGPLGSHSCLAECNSFRHAKTVSERWSLLVGRGACFRCLKFGHIAVQCPEGNCTVNNCYQNHHPSLHPVDPVYRFVQPPV